jgi:hypothetical protein
MITSHGQNRVRFDDSALERWESEGGSLPASQPRDREASSEQSPRAPPRIWPQAGNGERNASCPPRTPI